MELIDGGALVVMTGVAELETIDKLVVMLLLLLLSSFDAAAVVVAFGGASGGTNEVAVAGGCRCCCGAKAERIITSLPGRPTWRR